MTKENSITPDILVVMEKAAKLKVMTGYEEKILGNRMRALKEYSMKTQVTPKQLEVFQDMADRYDASNERLNND